MNLTHYSDLPVSERKYSLALLSMVCEGISKFSDLKKRTGCSKPCLSYTLRDLTVNGYVVRNESDYKCTEKGSEFLGEIYERRFKEDEHFQDMFVSLVQKKKFQDRILTGEQRECLREIWRAESPKIIQEAMDKFHLND